MEEKNNVIEVAENTVPAETEKSSAGSFKCIAAPHDKRIFVIALLTAIITVILYHFVMTAVEYFCKNDETEIVSCYCHNISSEEDEDGEKAKKFLRRHKKMDGKRGEFFRNMPPEMREKIKNMSPEERREFFAKLRRKRNGKDAPERPEGRRPRRRAEAAQQE